MDQTIKSPRELEDFLNLPMIGAIPKKRFWQKVFIKDTPKIFLNSRYVDAYRNLSDQVRLLQSQKGIRSLLIAAPDLKEGASTITANLGFYLAHHYKKKVLIIDANYRQPSMHRIFRLKQKQGLFDLINGNIEFDQSIEKFSEDFFVLPAGQTTLNPVTFLDSAKMREVLEKARNCFDVVLIDCADLKRCKDSVLMAAQVDGIVLLVSENKTRRLVIEKVTAPLKEFKSNLVGTILNNRTFAIPQFVYERI